jgi:hypothetical protein
MPHFSDGQAKKSAETLSGKREALGKLRSNGGKALLHCSGKGGFWLAVWIAHDDPKPGAINFVVARADGAGELRDFEWKGRRVSEIKICVTCRARLRWRMAEEIHQDATRIIH